MDETRGEKRSTWSRARLSRRTLLKGLGMAALAGSFPYALTGCAQPSPAGQPGATAKPATPLKPVVLAHGAELPSWSPYGHTSDLFYAQWKHVMEHLVTYDWDKGQWLPLLAESWKVDDQGNWAFTLRKGVKFHNGADFTARDVIHSYTRAINDKDSAQKAQLPDLKDITAPDNYTVAISTKTPDSGLLSKAPYNVVISSEAVFKEFGAEADRHPIGTGPFKFKDWTRGGFFVAEMNDKYWGGPPKIDTVMWKAIGETGAKIAALERGEVDLIDSVPPHEVERLDALPDVRLEIQKNTAIMFLSLRPDTKPFTDKKVRLAVAHALDVDSIIKNVLNGRADRLIGPVAEGVIGYDPTWKPLPYDPEKAKSLLAEAGYPNGFDIDLQSPSGRFTKDLEIAQAMAGQLNRVGIRATVKTGEFATWWTDAQAGKFPMYFMNQGMAGDPDLFVRFYYQTGVTKRLGYSNPEVDRLLKEQGAAFDAAKRLKILQQALTLVKEDCPALWLFAYHLAYGVRERLVWKPPQRDGIWMLLHKASVRA